MRGLQNKGLHFLVVIRVHSNFMTTFSQWEMSCFNINWDTQAESPGLCIIRAFLNKFEAFWVFSSVSWSWCGLTSTTFCACFDCITGTCHSSAPPAPLCPSHTHTRQIKLTLMLLKNSKQLVKDDIWLEVDRTWVSSAIYFGNDKLKSRSLVHPGDVWIWITVDNSELEKKTAFL